MSGSFKKLFAQIKQTSSYKKEKAKIDFTIELQALMKKNLITRADLARELNKSNAYVTQILRGERNFTIDTMVELAEALDSQLAIHFSPKGENTVDWFRIIKNAPDQKRKPVLASAARFRKMQGLVSEDYQKLDPSNQKMDNIHGNETNGYPVAA
jgi:transcriptional regulator with XRE-family HTH domain